MYKKHFERLAKILSYPSPVLRFLLPQLCNLLREVNTRFDEEKFYDSLERYQPFKPYNHLVKVELCPRNGYSSSDIFGILAKMKEGAAFKFEYYEGPQAIVVKCGYNELLYILSRVRGIIQFADVTEKYTLVS